MNVYSTIFAFNNLSMEVYSCHFMKQNRVNHTPCRSKQLITCHHHICHLWLFVSLPCTKSTMPNALCCYEKFHFQRIKLIILVLRMMLFIKRPPIKLKISSIIILIKNSSIKRSLRLYKVHIIQQMQTMIKTVFVTSNRSGKKKSKC